MTDHTADASTCCMNTSDECRKNGPCQYLREEFSDEWTAHVPSHADTRLLMHESLKLSGASRERAIIIEWLNDVKRSPFADMIRDGEHHQWWNNRPHIDH